MYKEVYGSVSRKDESYLSLALKLARLSKCKFKHGAVVVRGGSVLALGVNVMKNDPASLGRLEEGKSDILSVHAEIDALRQVKDPRGTTVYVARLTKGNPAFSRPCERCAKKLIVAGVKEVVYT